jgi:hypothetical protein
MDADEMLDANLLCATIGVYRRSSAVAFDLGF